jgi:hypothetical protein
MRIPRKITISAALTVTALLAAAGMAMATPASTGLPSPATGSFATGVTPTDLDCTHDRAGQMLEDVDAMHGAKAAMHGAKAAMHGDAEQMRQHHARMIERDPQMQQRHDEMVDKYPEMGGHMDAFDGSPAPGR